MVRTSRGRLSATVTISARMVPTNDNVSDEILRQKSSPFNVVTFLSRSRYREASLDSSAIFIGYCQGDVYACLQGNNVSCRVACATYGRVTCLTYQNTRACEQYLRERSESSLWMDDGDRTRCDL